MSMGMGMGMSQIMTGLGGSGGKPWQGQIMQMKLSPRMRLRPVAADELDRILNFTGITAPTPERKLDATNENVPSRPLS